MSKLDQSFAIIPLMRGSLILSLFILTLLSDVSFAAVKLEIKNLNKLYCKDVQEKRFPKHWSRGLFHDGTEVDIKKYTTYFYKNSFYKLLNKYKKKQTYVELDMTSSPYFEFYTEFNYYENELNYSFFMVFPDRLLTYDGKKIKEYYEKKKDKVGIFIIKLNKQNLNGTYEFISSPILRTQYKDTTGEFVCAISSRKI